MFGELGKSHQEDIRTFLLLCRQNAAAFRLESGKIRSEAKRRTKATYLLRPSIVHSLPFVLFLLPLGLPLGRLDDDPLSATPAPAADVDAPGVFGVDTDADSAYVRFEPPVAGVKACACDCACPCDCMCVCPCDSARRRSLRYLFSQISSNHYPAQKKGQPLT